LFGGLLLALYLLKLKKAFNNERKREVENTLQFLVEKIIKFTCGLDYSPGWIHGISNVTSEIKINYISKQSYRVPFAQTFLNLHRNLKGNVAKRLEDVYYELGLDQTGIQHLRDKKSRHLHAKIIRDFAQMRVTHGIPEIQNLIKSRSSVIRMEASIALLVLDNENALLALESSEDYSMWQRIKILETAKRMPPQSLPNLVKALGSKNEFVVYLAINLINHFYHPVEESDLILVFENWGEKFFTELLVTAIERDFTTLKGILMEKFDSLEEEENKIAALKELKLSRRKNWIPILTDIAYNPKNPDSVRVEALRSACQIAQRDQLEIQIPMPYASDEKLNRMLLHAKDALI
jgi:hypothetical protein